MSEKTSTFKHKMQEILTLCQDELKRTTEIGKKMLHASKANTQLHQYQQELGELAVKELREQKLTWINPRAKELLDLITECETELLQIEGQVNTIRFQEDDPTDIPKS
jgi:hypothetical protein